ncbi:uncharacterized protein FMAN_11499 [Fusarium mangiferae]|uniref:Uncharacterized protein n=1 Tax=Fusarium mangiferae TaxID=192010 RepID=A0A1L7TRK6_FUSMA|nr:uncharacterized protein FMAN_11499 [Fusarium mangiferae]CVK97416.1 uncharacterized protein FMAN_11499 [Fusarium mangiferae]
MCMPFSTRRQDPIDLPPRYYKNYDSEYPVSSSSAYSRQRDQARTNKINEMNAARKASRDRNKKRVKSFLLRNPGGGAIVTHHGAIAGAIAAGGAGGF